MQVVYSVFKEMLRVFGETWMPESIPGIDIVSPDNVKITLDGADEC